MYKGSRQSKFMAGLATLTLLLPAMATHAIVMRHDVDPNEYLLDVLDYQSTLVIHGCTATLVAPRWILTAAHCIDPGDQDYASGKMLTVGDEQIEIAQAYRHLDFNSQNMNKYDIALIELAAPSYSILPTPVYEGQDELSKVMKLAGYGVVGDGVQDIYDRCFPCQLRGADNEVAKVDGYLLSYRFDHPDEPTSLPLEGVGAGGDSGGPAYIETDAGRFVAGVSSFGSRHYKEFDNYTRVSTRLDWLAEVMSTDYPGSYAGPLYSQKPQSDTPANESSSSGGSFGFAFLLVGGLFGWFRSYW